MDQESHDKIIKQYDIVNTGLKKHIKLLEDYVKILEKSQAKIEKSVNKAIGANVNAAEASQDTIIKLEEFIYSFGVKQFKDKINMLKLIDPNSISQDLISKMDDFKISYQKNEILSIEYLLNVDELLTNCINK